MNGHSFEELARPPGATGEHRISSDRCGRYRAEYVRFVRLDAAIRAGAVEPRSLFLDHEIQRWQPVSDLGIFQEAKQAKEVSEARDRSNGSKAESGRSAIQGLGPAPEDWAKREWSSALVGAIATMVALIAFTAWVAGAALATAVQTLISQTPDSVPTGGAAVVFVILAEEFYWFALMLFGIRGTGFVRRFALQALSLLSTCVLLYAASAFFEAEAFDLSLRLFAEHAGIAGVAYALSLLLWSILLFREADATPVKKALASVVASLMLASTFYMAVTPSVRHETQTRQNDSAAGPQVSSCRILIAPTPTRMTPAPTGITVPPPRISVRLSVSVTPAPARVASPAGIVLRLGEDPLWLRQPRWAESSLGTAEAKPEEDA